MLNNFLKFAKESGVLGNGIWWIISGAISGLLILINKKYGILIKIITISIPLYSYFIIVLIILAIGIYIFKMRNEITVKNYGKLYGYYRKYCYMEYHPYNRIREDSFYELVSCSMDFVIVKNGIATIGPYVHYSYPPRGQNGKDEIHNPKAKCLINNKITDQLHCDIEICNTSSSMKNDKMIIFLRSHKPFKKGDIITIVISYEVLGQHAICKEELEAFLSSPDLKNNYRNLMQKKMECEMIYGFLRYAASLKIKVIFPEDYPWRHLDNIEDSFAISAATRPFAKTAITGMGKAISSRTTLEVIFKKGIGFDHGFYIFWNVPTKQQLISLGYIKS